MVMKLQKEQRKRAEKENNRRNRDQDDREIEHDNNRDFNSLVFPDKKKPSRKVEGFGANTNFASFDDKDTLKSESIMLFDAQLLMYILLNIFYVYRCWQGCVLLFIFWHVGGEASFVLFFNIL